MASTFLKLPPDVGVSPGSVDSFNGRTGVVVSQAGDYAAGIVANTPAGNISATNVQDAINELDSEKQATITGAATTIVSSNLTASRALESNGSGKVAASSVTSTELGHLSGVTSSVQTQLNAKQPLDSDLTAIAALSSNGLVAKTGLGTAAVRTITGTASNITVSNGDGVSGNPTIDLPNTAVIPNSYTNPNLTIDSKGRIIAASNGSAASMNPDQSRVISDDFIANSVAAGTYAWTINNTGAGANATTVTTLVDTTEKALGVMQLNCGSTSSGRSTVHTGLTSLSTQIATMSMIQRVAIGDYGTGTDSYELTFGGVDNTGNSLGHTDGAYFRFIGDGVNTVWDCVTSAAGVSTITSTAVVATPNQFQRFQIIINEAATSVQFLINGVLVATHTTNIPQSGDLFGYGFKIIKTAGTNTMQAFVDYAYLELSWSGPR